MDEVMLASIICREMKWTYEEYLQSPAHFIDNILEMLKSESKASKNK